MEKASVGGHSDPVRPLMEIRIRLCVAVVEIQPNDTELLPSRIEFRLLAGFVAVLSGKRLTDVRWSRSDI